VSTKAETNTAEVELVYVSGQRWCGSGGCTLLILQPQGSSFRVIGKVTIVQLPFAFYLLRAIGIRILACASEAAAFNLGMKLNSLLTEKHILKIRRCLLHNI
jgi:hypothetical protein